MAEKLLKYQDEAIGLKRNYSFRTNEQGGDANDTILVFVIDQAGSIVTLPGTQNLPVNTVLIVIQTAAGNNRLCFATKRSDGDWNLQAISGTIPSYAAVLPRLTSSDWIWHNKIWQTKNSTNVNAWIDSGYAVPNALVGIDPYSDHNVFYAKPSTYVNNASFAVHWNNQWYDTGGVSITLGDNSNIYIGTINSAINKFPIYVATQYGTWYQGRFGWANGPICYNEDLSHYSPINKVIAFKNGDTVIPIKVDI